MPKAPTVSVDFTISELKAIATCCSKNFIGPKQPGWIHQAAARAAAKAKEAQTPAATGAAHKHLAGRRLAPLRKGVKKVNVRSVAKKPGRVRTTQLTRAGMPRKAPTRKPVKRQSRRIVRR